MRINLLGITVAYLLSGLLLVTCQSAHKGEDANAAPLAVTGTYSYELPDEAGTGQFLISQLDNEALRYSLTVVGGPPAYHQGFAEGEAWFGPGNTANIVIGDASAPCEIQLLFTSEGLEAKTLKGSPADCGFGNGVRADGKYQRTSSMDPFLPPGAETSSNLMGEWVSVDDPRSVLKIDGGQYVEIYDEEEMGRFDYDFFPECPTQCGSIEDMSCLLVKGEMDATCYAIVKATEETLEMSLVGGRGNTLTYRRK